MPEQTFAFGLHEALELPRAGLLRDVSSLTDSDRDDPITVRVALIHQPLEHVVDGDVGGCAKQRTLALLGELQHQLADGGGLAGAWWPL